MADRVIFCSFNKPVPGRETPAIASFRDAGAYCQGMLEAGRIKSYDQVLLDPHGGLGGFMLIKGDAGGLAQIAMDPVWQEICFRANATVDGFGVVGGTTGEATVPMMEAFAVASAALV